MNEATARSAAIIGLVLLVSSLASPITLLDDVQDSSESNENGCVVCINEVMANADGSDQGIFPQGEWVELWNSGDSDVNILGWTIVDIGGWTHPINEESWVNFDQLTTPYMIEAGGYVVIAENEMGTLRLNNAGETIYLKDSTNTTVDTVVTSPSSNGVSKIADPNNSNSEWIDAESPSPGQANVNGGGGGSGSGGSGDSDWVDAGSAEWNGEYDIKFTSIMPGEVPGRDNDWLEITNFGNEEVNLTGWSIERIRPTTPWISTFGQFTIAAGESAVLSENPTNLLADGGIIAYDGNTILNNMPWLVDSGAALQLKEPEGTVVDALVY
ncbi:MAG TPA: lamin tail domain-containing protein, partial [Candidatus Thalassarchaeaceae archaeon]|nr:lamin tail domain-containing protein [Candidatus Thalassarchaeaceae archaeon]